MDGHTPKGKDEARGPANSIEQYEDRAEQNLRLWRLNETTDPARTRPVTIGRKFTAIDSYYQIKRATETFGPLGAGWGWELAEDVIECTTSQGATVSFAKCKVTLWYIDPESSERVTCGPVVGVNQLVNAKGNLDDEAFKKATTDGITKALSYLGFSADVFMGLFDDNKYVSRLKDEQTRKAEQSQQALPKELRDAVAGLGKVRDLVALDTQWKALKPALLKLPESQLDYMKARFAMRKRQLAPEQPEREPDSGEPELEPGRHPDDPGDDNGGDHRTSGPHTQV